jgi:hypothetical protein
MRRLRTHLTYANVMSTLAVFLVIGGGAAYAANTVFSSDIVDGEVKTNDLAANAVGSGKIADQQVKNADLGLGASSSNTIADGGIQGIDVKDNTLKGAVIDESTLNETLPSAFNTDGGPACDPDNASKTCVTTSLNLPRAHPVLIFLSGVRETTRFDDLTTATDYTDLVIGACYPRVDGANIGGPSAILTQREAFNDGGWTVGPENFSALQITNLAAGSHSIDMRCDETDGDLSIISPSIAAVALGT